MVFVFVCIFFAVLGLVFLCSGFTWAARAYVQGEGSWSKAQKQATIRLRKYAASRYEKDYQAFLYSLSIPLGDRVAGEQLEKPEPDYAAIHARFKQGKVAVRNLRLYGKRPRSGWNVGAKHRAARETVQGEENPGSDPTDERKRTRLIPVLFAIAKSPILTLLRFAVVEND
jgi:hypothetical protein